VVTNNDPIAIATSEIKIARFAGVHGCSRSSSNLLRRGAGGASGTALARKVAGLLRVMSLLQLGEIDSRSGERLTHHGTRGPRPETS
jgi:hypothetical protein